MRYRVFGVLVVGVFLAAFGVALELGGDLAVKGDLTVDRLWSDSVSTGTVSVGTTGGVSEGELVYLSGGAWGKAVAGARSTRAMGVMRGDGLPDVGGGIQIRLAVDGESVSVGDALYLSETAGKATANLGNGVDVQFVGVALESSSGVGLVEALVDVGEYLEIIY